MQLSCLITINVDNVGTISNVYWSDSIFFSCDVWCQLDIEIANVQLLSIESYSTPCKRIWIPESGKFCLWNPESGIFCLWDLDSRAQLFEGRLVFNPSFFLLCSEAFSRIIFSVILRLRAPNHQLVDKKNSSRNFF